jgi:hypothetical protein
LIELHSVPASQGRIAAYRISEDQPGGNGDHRQGPFRYAGSGNHCLSAVTNLRVSNSLHTCLSFVVLVSGSSCLLTFDLGAGMPFKRFFDQSQGGHDCDKSTGKQQPFGAVAVQHPLPLKQ